jgi:hypothetical protein
MSNPFEIATSKGCNCGEKLTFIADSKPLTGIHAKYTTHGGKTIFYARVHCKKCGALFEPDNDRFSAYFNEAAENIAK